ncbi:MAG: glycoside hydrolase family 3 protein, partial [Steroidobacteraceae bacterium]
MTTQRRADRQDRRAFRPHHAGSLAAALWLAVALGGAPLIVMGAPAVVTGDPKVDQLLGQMTLEEKMALIRGSVEDAASNQGQAGYLAGVPRLGVPSIRFANGPPGVVTRLPSQAETATMGVAATFSTEDAEQNGSVIAREARSLGVDLVLEPFINMDRDITFHRSYNTFGEDPVLTGQMGASEIRGIQSQGIMAMAKHYVGYDTDGADVIIAPQALHEIYVAPFKDAVDAGVSSIMCSYNKINGVDACGDPSTLLTILRDQLHFKGFVTSDWGAAHAPDFINRGLDMEMPGTLPRDSPRAAMTFDFFGTKPPDVTPPPAFNKGLLAGLARQGMPEEPPLNIDFGGFFKRHDDHVNFYTRMQSGELQEATITRAAGRVLEQINRFGLLDHPPSHAAQPHAVQANARIIRKTGEDAAVLLKNAGHILPLTPADLQSLALIGPGAGQVVSIGIAGERSTGWPERQVGPLQALRSEARGSHITYAVEDDMSGVPIPASYLTHNGEPGLRRTDGRTGAVHIDPILDFTQSKKTALPPDSETSWQGTLTVTKAGSYWIYLQLLGAAGNLRIDGTTVAATSSEPGASHGNTVLAGKDGLMPSTDGLDNVRAAVELSAGAHALTVTASPDSSGEVQQVRLAWVTPEQRRANHDAALAAAKAAK